MAIALGTERLSGKLVSLNSTRHEAAMFRFLRNLFIAREAWRLFRRWRR